MKRSMLERIDKLRELKSNTKLCPLVKFPLALTLKGLDEMVEMISKLTERVNYNHQLHWFSNIQLFVFML